MLQLVSWVERAMAACAKLCVPCVTKHTLMKWRAGRQQFVSAIALKIRSDVRPWCVFLCSEYVVARFAGGG